MQSRGLGPWIGAGLLAAACGGAPAQEFGAADVDNIKKQTQAFVEAYNAKDAAKISGFFAGAAVLMPPNSSTVRGQESIKGYFDTRFAEGGTNLGIDARDLAGHGPLAYVSGAYTVETRPPDGGKETRDRGKYLWVLRNFGGRWRFEYQMWSSDLPVPTAASTE